MEIPAKVELKVGEKYTLRLKGLAGAGYAWKHTIEEAGEIVSVSTEMSDHLQLIEKGRALPPGYNLSQLVTIQALSPGHAIMHLTLSRSWEKNKPPLEEHTIEIYVNS
jgi:predicted secreted protein